MQDYFRILSADWPRWLGDYIATPEMQRLAGVCMFCGSNYTNIFRAKHFLSMLEHSVGTALILWHFTRSKKQALAGLFHDISTPAFKHAVDFMNGDYEKQESTEDGAEKIIRGSAEIMRLLKRDRIKVSQVSDYKIYPLADNDQPGLAADRFEYNFSQGLTWMCIWDLKQIKKIYHNIVIIKNENGVDELAFKKITLAEEWVCSLPKMWQSWCTNRNKIIMQFWADILRSMVLQKFLKIDDLWILSEKEIMERIRKCPNRNLRQAYRKFRRARHVRETDYKIGGKYSIKAKTKRRYALPLVAGLGRIDKLSQKARDAVNDYLNIKEPKYVSFHFGFWPNGKPKPKPARFFWE